jgi:predicted alpha/beta hydrolase family esterase
MTNVTLRAWRVLLLPGWLDSLPPHWQARWQAEHGFEKVEQDDWQWPRRGDWMARLDDVLLAGERPALLVAHSLGCQLVASWAAHSRHTARVAGALMVAPPDTEREDMPPQLFNWRPVSRRPLPFPGVVVLSTTIPSAPRTAAERWPPPGAPKRSTSAAGATSTASPGWATGRWASICWAGWRTAQGDSGQFAPWSRRNPRASVSASRPCSARA